MIQITKSGVHDEKQKEYQVEHIDSMMLFKIFLTTNGVEDRRRQGGTSGIPQENSDQYGNNNDDNTVCFCPTTVYDIKVFYSVMTFTLSCHRIPIYFQSTRIA